MTPDQFLLSFIIGGMSLALMLMVPFVLFLLMVTRPPVQKYLTWVRDVSLPAKIIRELEDELLEQQKISAFLKKTLDKCVGIPLLPPSDEGELLEMEE